VAVIKRLGVFEVDVAFRVPLTGVTALFGPSGSGKTSVINMIAGLIRPERGRIDLDGRTLFDSEAGVDLPPHRRRIGYVFQDGRLFPHLSVRSNLLYGLRRVRKSERFIQFDPVVQLLGIGHLLHRRPGRLSGGEKQRVAMGRALLTSPRLLLMDEPLASLDQARKREILPFIARLPGEFSVPIVYVSHDPEEILALAGGAVVLEAGRVAAWRESDELGSLLAARARRGPAAA